MSDEKLGAAATLENELQQSALLKKAWDAVPHEGGKKGCVFDVTKESVGVLAITEDGTMILNRQVQEDFVVVSRDEVFGWRIAPYRESKEVRFESVTDLLN